MQFKKDGRWAIDFVGKRKYAAIFSVLMVITSLVVFIVVKPNWGIDFTGGTEIQIQTTPAADIGEIRGLLGKLDLGSDAVQQVGEDDSGQFVIRIQDPSYGTEGMEDLARQDLAAAFGENWVQEMKVDKSGVQVIIRVTYEGEPLTNEALFAALTDQRVKGENGIQRVHGEDNKFEITYVETAALVQDKLFASDVGLAYEVSVLESQQVGPKVGGELREKGMLAILATLALILVYVAFRFELAFAPGAVFALFHDVSIVVGIFTLTGHEFNLSMIGALLTIIGYSLNDTIVIYDRIRENMSKYRRRDTERLINDSINETLSRTLATSFTTMLAMSAFLMLGGAVIETFALAIMFGVVFGTYSTVFVASPTILVMEDLKPRLGKAFAPLASKDGDGDSDGPQTAAEARAQERESLKRAGREA